MVKYENECVCCPREMGCLGDSCPYTNVRRIYCDSCGDEYSETELKEINNQHICIHCFREMCEEYFDNLPKIDWEDID